MYICKLCECMYVAISIYNHTWYPYSYFCIYSYFSMHVISEAFKRSKSSLLLEVNQFLQYVKDKFFDVLLPVESIAKQSLLGKGIGKLCMTVLIII